MILEEQFLLSIYKFYTLGSPWLLWLTGRYTVWPFICRWCPAGNQDQKKMNHQLMDVFDQLMLRKRAIIETIYDQLKNISPIAQTRHRRGINFLVNTRIYIASATSSVIFWFKITQQASIRHIVSALITILLSRRKNFRCENVGRTGVVGGYGANRYGLDYMIWQAMFGNGALAGMALLE